MADLHVVIARAIVVYFALLGVWGLVLVVLRAPLGGSYRGALIIGGALGVAQAVVGLLLFVAGQRPRDDLHYLYGLSVIVTLPLVQQYLTGRRVPTTLVYGLACFFIMGLGIRGITTGA
jgi:hypothetical protein